MTINDAKQLTNFLLNLRLGLSTEKNLQDDLEAAFRRAGFSAIRECSLSPKDRVDFLVETKAGDVAVECKIRGAEIEVWRQISRYARHERICAVILISSKTMGRGFPREVEGKPLFLVNASRGWI